MSVKAMKEKNPNFFRYGLIGAVFLVLFCLVGILIYNIATSEDGADDVAATTPTTPPTAVAISPTESADTPTPTLVITEPTDEPAPEPTNTPRPTNTPSPTPDTSAADFTTTTTTVVSIEPGPVENVLKNGGFENGFASNGVAREWSPFKSDDITVIYSGEGSGPYVDGGKTAQRITTFKAELGDRYTGIYQQVQVIPGQTYELTLKGQIRTGFGSVEQSKFGYRMAYAISQRGVKNWQVVPDEDWVELPWDEQLINSPDVSFLEYTTEVVPSAETITLFIRTWNKWADPGEAHFTLDSLSLKGPSVVVNTVEVQAAAVGGSTSDEEFTPGQTASETTTTETSQEELVNNGLPKTGSGDDNNFMSDGRFWGALIILLVLAAGATFRSKWSY